MSATCRDSKAGEFTVESFSWHNVKSDMPERPDHRDLDTKKKKAKLFKLLKNMKYMKRKVHKC